jgi:hypothetical protein
MNETLQEKLIVITQQANKIMAVIVSEAKQKNLPQTRDEELIK